MRGRYILGAARRAGGWRFGCDEKEVRRMLDPAHTGTKISRYAGALAVCNIEIEVTARPIEAPREATA